MENLGDIWEREPETLVSSQPAQTERRPTEDLGWIWGQAIVDQAAQAENSDFSAID